MSQKLEMIGMLDLPRIESARRVYSGGGLSPTVMTGAEKDINILLYEDMDYPYEGKGPRDDSEESCYGG